MEIPVKNHVRFFTIHRPFIYNNFTLSGQGKSTGSKNYYKVLGLSSTATSEEIERAYHKMIKNAHFDRSLSKKQIELAYLILTDEAHRAMHDAVIEHDEKEMEITAKIRNKKEMRLTVKNLVQIAIGLFIIAVAFFFFRFGYQLKSFSTGDTVYYKESHKLLGTIVEVQDRHDFGRASKAAYKIKSPSGQFIWIPKNDVKVSCYKK
jgi:curved DNA-binding protein CbpA